MARKSFFILALLTFAYGTTLLAATGESLFEGGDVLYTKPLPSVLFTHQLHVNQKQISCDRCHDGLFALEALKAEAKKDFTMESLYRGKYCGACHDGKTAFASDTQCARCHLRARDAQTQPAAARPKAMPSYKTSVSLGKGKTAARFNHETHTGSQSCAVCHPGLFRIKKGANSVTLADHGKPTSCFACHDGKKAFSWNDCGRCHAGIKVPQAPSAFGAGDKAVPFAHKSHSARLKCDSCHTGLFPFEKGATKITLASHMSGKVCFACHKKTNGTAFYENCGGCHKDRKPMPAPTPKATVTPAPQAKVPPPPVPQAQGSQTWVYTVEGAGPVAFSHEKSHGAFGCSECHTEAFVKKKGGTKMSMAQMYEGKGCGLCHDGKTAFRATECVKCHQGN